MEPLAGSVKRYFQHVLFFTGKTDWPPDIEKEEPVCLLAHETEKLLGGDRKTVKITACDGPSSGSGWDLLLLPDGILYRQVRPSDFRELAARHLVGREPVARLSPVRVPGRHILVCTHGRRDERCGACGPPLLQRLKQEIASMQFEEPVQVYATSHVGGHKYAGNVLFYPEGDWYGYVRPQDVPELLRRQLLEGRIWAPLWRGRMGLSEEEQQAAVSRFEA